jgi:PEGA domain
MKSAWILFLSVAAAISVCGETSTATSDVCKKSISFAVAADGQPVAAIPSFAAHWIANEKHQRQFPELCFAQAPDPRTRNYLVVFSTQQEGLIGLAPTVLKYVNSTPVSEDSTLGAIYGQMWHFTSVQPAAASTTLNLLHTETSTVLFVRAYNEQGATVSQLSLKDVSGWFHTKERLLERVVGEIQTDSRPAVSSPASLRASLPVYYVNCDVPVKALASEEPPRVPPAPAAPAVQLATLDFSSNPTGADVYEDGGFVGKTPSSVTVSPGEHTITMSRPNFSTWQRKLQVSEGRRRIAGYLEQKVVTLGSGLP